MTKKYIIKKFVIDKKKLIIYFLKLFFILSILNVPLFLSISLDLESCFQLLLLQIILLDFLVYLSLLDLFKEDFKKEIEEIVELKEIKKVKKR